MGIGPCPDRCGKAVQPLDHRCSITNFPRLWLKLIFQKYMPAPSSMYGAIDSPDSAALRMTEPLQTFHLVAGAILPAGRDLAPPRISSMSDFSPRGRRVGVIFMTPRPRPGGPPTPSSSTSYPWSNDSHMIRAAWRRRIAHPASTATRRIRSRSTNVSPGTLANRTSRRSRPTSPTASCSSYGHFLPYSNNSREL